MDLESRLKELFIKLKDDEFYFSEFYELTKKQIYFNIYSILKDHHLSEDVLQETYVSFLKHLDSINVNKPILGYLYKTSRNKAIDYYRKNKHLIDYELIENQRELSYEEKYDGSEELLEKLKGILDKIEYQVVILHVLNELTNKEIAKIINRPINTVIWIYNKAIKKLKERLGESYVYR